MPRSPTTRAAGSNRPPESADPISRSTDPSAVRCRRRWLRGQDQDAGQRGSGSGHGIHLLRAEHRKQHLSGKAVQRSAGAVAIGPVLQGLNRPVNDRRRGWTVTDIVNTVAVTAIQAQSVGRDPQNPSRAICSRYILGAAEASATIRPRPHIGGPGVGIVPGIVAGPGIRTVRERRLRTRPKASKSSQPILNQSATIQFL